MGSNPAMESMQALFKSNVNDAGISLNPNFRYLRVVVDGRVVFLALGYEDKDAKGPIEVWYSAEREVFRFQNGRLIGAAGLNIEWRNVTLPVLPSWSEISRTDNSIHWTRIRDVMPNYRFGVQDKLVLHRIAAPVKSESQGLNLAMLTWFEEQTASALHDTALPVAHYAVDLREGRETVVYGKQCLSAELCFSWQRWPVASTSSNKTQAEK